jgi:hypothetical protein
MILGGLKVGGLCYRVARDDVLIQERERGSEAVHN